MNPKSKIYPFENYKIPKEIIEKATKFHFIKVPLLGQYNAIRKKDDWCGRTAASIINNYYVKANNLNAKKDDYICHGPEKNDAYGYDLRYPDGTPAFRILKHDDESMIGKAAGYEKAFPNSKVDKNYLFPYTITGDERLKKGEEIAKDEDSVQKYFIQALDILKKGKPLLLYSGFSGRESAPIHLIVVCGFCYLPDKAGDKKDKLWLLVADPATQGKKIYLHNVFTPPYDPEKDSKVTLRQLTSRHYDCKRLDFLENGKNDLIRLDKGDWFNSKASLILIRASKFFRTHTASEKNNQDLFMDYWSYGSGYDRRGGYYLSSNESISIPKELILSNVQDFTHFPIKIEGNERSPLAYYNNNESIESGLGGYFALGLQRNIHAGIHLFPPDENQKVNKTKLKQPPAKQYTELRINMAEESYIKEKGKKNKVSVKDGTIQNLQKKLKKLGFFNYNYFVGNFGGGTEKSVLSFQKAAKNDSKKYGSNFTEFTSGVADAATQKEIDFWLLNDLPPKKKKQTSIKNGYTPIHSFADGYIVAARLPNFSVDNPGKELISFSNNYPGFVLLCNEYYVVGDEEKKKHRIFNLYMHLTSPDYKSIEKDPYTTHVPWFEKLSKKQHGAFVNVSGVGDSIGKICWLNKPIAKGQEISPNQKFEVFDHESVIPVVSDKEGNETIHWVYKAPPSNYVEVFNNLKLGHMITTTSPLLPVKGDEIVGFLSKAKGAPEKTMSFTIGADENGQGGNDVSGKIRTGFIHWELFASHDGSDDKPLDKLFEILGEDFGASNILNEADFLSNEDNFWTIDEFKDTMLSGITNDKEKKYLEDGFKKEADNENGALYQYAEKVVEMLNDPKSFNNTEDQSESEGDDFVGNTYDCTIDINCTGFPKSSDGHYYITLEYLNIVDDVKKPVATRKLKIKKSDTGKNEKLSYNIKVPIGANAIEIIPHNDTKDFFIEANGTDDNNTKEVMQKVIKHRWRDALVRMNSEWKFENIEKLINTLNSELGSLGVSFDIEKVASTSWWGSVGGKDIWYNFYSEKGIKTPSLFKETANESANNDEAPLLNENGKITAAHPVTVAWAWNYLEGKNKINTVGSNIVKEISFADDYQPICWGINSLPVEKDDSNTENIKLKLGLPARVTIVDDDFAFDNEFNKVKFVLIEGTNEKKKDKLIGNESVFGPGGIYIKDLIVDFWGWWSIYPFFSQESMYDKAVNKHNIGLNTFHVEPPSFGKLDEKEKDAFSRIYKGSQSWQIMLKMKSSCNGVNGLVRVDVSKDGNKWEKDKYYLPVLESKYLTGEFKSESVNYDKLEIKDNIITLKAAKKIRDRIKITKKIQSRENNYIYNNYVKQISCSLADLLQATSNEFLKNWKKLANEKGLKKCKTSISIKWVCADGINCIISGARYYNCSTKGYGLAYVEKEKDSETKKNNIVHSSERLYDAAISLKDKYPELKMEKSENGKEVLISIADKSKLKDISKCSNIKEENCELSKDDKFILWLVNGKTKVSESFWWSEYNNAHDIRISTMLAHAIEKLYYAQKNEKPTFVVSHIGWNGLFCKVTGTHLLDIAKSLNVFDLVEVDGSDLKLTVFPPLKNALAVKFSAPDESQEIIDKWLKDTNKLHYRFSFIALSGLQFSKTYNEIEEAAYFDSKSGKKIIDECPESIVYPVVSKTGYLEKTQIELRILNIKLAPNSKGLHIRGSFRGKKSIWLQSSIVFKSRVKGGEYKKNKPIKITDSHFNNFGIGSIDFIVAFPKKGSDYEYSMDIIKQEQPNLIISEKISTGRSFDIYNKDYWLNWHDAIKVTSVKNNSSGSVVLYNSKPVIEIAQQPVVIGNDLFIRSNTTGIHTAKGYSQPFATNITSQELYGKGKAFSYKIKKNKKVIIDRTEFNYEYAYHAKGGFVNYKGEIIASLDLTKSELKEKLKKENGPFEIIIERSVKTDPIIESKINFNGI